MSRTLRTLAGVLRKSVMFICGHLIVDLGQCGTLAKVKPQKFRRLVSRFAQTYEDQPKNRVITVSNGFAGQILRAADGGHDATQGASIFATTDSSKKVFPGVGSPPMKNTVDSGGKDTGDEENAVNVKALNVAVAAGNLGKFKENPIFKDYEYSTPGTGFSFAKVAKPTKDSKPDEKATADDDEDESSIVEFTPIKEKDSIFSKRCKLFVKTDGNYSDSGIGTLHIKKVDVKVQALVRADTSIATRRCRCRGWTKPPPTSELLRAKTRKEADELYA
ncbi:nucleoporin [Culex quinquefasciatus]|uniref:Nucleoporin n=1 Tax=Culex quinquefasciatus TaxID=7176 RepID=B0XF19_CULQU|nr:nucleoporin [Culex quinquefasciatus]|eukprot:XP_001868241.1 nucleoporin [Culex quinquefasciatus]